MKEEPRISTGILAAQRPAPDFVEHVRRYVENKYGWDALNKEGLQVYTTVDLDLTAAARAAMDTGLRELDKRQGYRGPLKKVIAERLEEWLRGNSPALAGDLKAGQTVEGVITNIDRENIQVSIGYVGEEGSRKAVIGKIKIDPDPKWWVRKPFLHPEMLSRKFAEGDIPFQVGDVILVRVVSPATEQPGPDPSASFLLEPDQIPQVQGALMTRENTTGYVRVLIGGSGSTKSEFNRVTQARREAGSSFHPVIYGAALEKGLTPSDMITGDFLTLQSPAGGEAWHPVNDHPPRKSSVSLRTGLIQSLNIPTIRLLQEIEVDYARSYARSLGYMGPLHNNLTLALGTANVSLEEQVNAYSVYPNRGYYIPHIYVKKIVDRHGKVLEEHQPPVLPDDWDQSNLPEVSKTSEETDLPSGTAAPSEPPAGNSPFVRRAIGSNTASAMTNILQGVVQEGAAKVLKEIVGRPDIAGKTGTTNDNVDAWFLGFSPDYTCGVWVGFDDAKSLGDEETGARAAAPIWGYFMREALKGTEVKDFSSSLGGHSTE